MIAWWLDLQLPVQSVPITTNIVSSIPAEALQQYVIKFVSDLRPGRWFFPGTPFSSSKETDVYDITEI